MWKIQGGTTDQLKPLNASGATDSQVAEIAVRATPAGTIKQAVAHVALLHHELTHAPKAGVCHHPGEEDNFRRLFAWLEAWNKDPTSPAPHLRPEDIKPRKTQHPTEANPTSYPDLATNSSSSSLGPLLSNKVGATPQTWEGDYADHDSPATTRDGTTMWGVCGEGGWNKVGAAPKGRRKQILDNLGIRNATVQGPETWLADPTIWAWPPEAAVSTSMMRRGR